VPTARTLEWLVGTVGTMFNSAAELEKDGTVQLSLNSKVVDP
jgi:hypothetical protein